MYVEACQLLILSRSNSPRSVLDLSVCGDTKHQGQSAVLLAACGAAAAAAPPIHGNHRGWQVVQLPAVQALLPPTPAQHDQPQALRVSVGSWTAERREMYRAAASSIAGARFKCVLPDDCPPLARSLAAEAEAVLALLESQRCSALHFGTWEGAISGRHTSDVMLRVLSSWRFQERQAGCLQELAIHDWLACREACAALPAVVAAAGSGSCLRRLLLSGCGSRLDLRPLAQMGRLEGLAIETDALPDLSSLPAGLRRLELEVAGVGARVMLPPHLQLDVLRVSCPHGRIFADMPALLRQCQEVHLQCSTAVLLGLLDQQAQLSATSSTSSLGSTSCGSSSSSSSLVRRGAAALVDAFLQLPAQRLHLQSSQLAFAFGRPASGCLPPPAAAWPRRPHELRFVQTSRVDTVVMAAALQHWQQVAAAPLAAADASAAAGRPGVQQEAVRGMQLSKRGGSQETAGVQQSVFRLPPLAELSASSLRFLSVLALPSELCFAPGCSAVQQAILLHALYLGRARQSLRCIANLKLSAWADLSPFAGLESVAGSWEFEGSTAPAKPLPLGLRHLDLTAGRPGAVLDGSGLLPGFAGSLAARGFSAVHLPASSHLLQLDMHLSNNSGSSSFKDDSGSGTGNSCLSCIGSTAVRVPGRTDRLFLRMPQADAGAAAVASAGYLIIEVGPWLGQADLTVIDMMPPFQQHSSDCSSSACSSSSDKTSSVSAPAALHVQLVFPGQHLVDLFSGGLQAAAAGGLRRLEILLGAGMQHFNCPHLRFVACQGLGHSSTSRTFDLRDLRQLSRAEMAGWQFDIVARPWRIVLQHVA